MICSNCGYDVEPGKRFCPNCGCPMPEEEMTESKDPAAEETQATEDPAAAPEEKPAEEVPEEIPEETAEESADAASEAPAEEGVEASGKTPEEAPTEAEPEAVDPAPPQEKPKPEGSGKKAQDAEKKSVLRDRKAFPKLIIERNYLLSYVLGGVFFSFFTYFSNVMISRLGATLQSSSSIAVQVTAIFSVSLSLMNSLNLLIFGVTIGAMLLSHIVKKKTGAHIISMIGVIAAAAIEILWIFLCLALGNKLLGIYLRTSDEALARTAVVLFRRIGIGALIMTLVSAVLGFIFHWKRCWIYLAADLAVVIIAMIVVLFGAFVFRKPGPIAVGLGLVQAGIYLFPAIGFNVLGGKTAETEQN